MEIYAPFNSIRQGFYTVCNEGKKFLDEHSTSVKIATFLGVCGAFGYMNVTRPEAGPLNSTNLNPLQNVSYPTCGLEHNRTEITLPLQQTAVKTTTFLDAPSAFGNTFLAKLIAPSTEDTSLTAMQDNPPPVCELKTEEFQTALALRFPTSKNLSTCRALGITPARLSPSFLKDVYRLFSTLLPLPVMNDLPPLPLVHQLPQAANSSSLGENKPSTLSPLLLTAYKVTYNVVSYSFSIASGTFAIASPFLAGFGFYFGVRESSGYLSTKYPTK